MKPRAPAASAPNSPRWYRNTASTISKRPSSASPAGTRPIRMRSSGTTSPDPSASSKRCAARWRHKMGRYVFKLPDVGEGTAEAEIVAWHVKVGDTIEEDQNLVDVMTDKATVEMTSPVSGRVISLHGEPGQMAAVGSALVELEVEGAGNAAGNGVSKPAPTPKEKNISLSPSGGEGRGEGASASSHSAPPKSSQQSPPHPSPLPLRGRGSKDVKRTFGDKPLASPAVRQRARDLGIELQYVPGSGPAGRIGHADLDAYMQS